MERFTLAENTFVLPTPGGVFHTFSNPSPSPVKQLIRSLLHKETSPLLSLEGLKQWTKLEDADQVVGLLNHAQGAKWVQGFDSPVNCPEGSIEGKVPGMLTKLSSQGKVLLADSQGFYLSSAGFNHEVAEELSALSADLANIHERRSGLLLNNMGFHSSAWSVVDASGSSRLGFWPIYIGELRFVLIIQGMPKFNQAIFVQLVWMLNLRYSANKA